MRQMVAWSDHNGLGQTLGRGIQLSFMGIFSFGKKRAAGADSEADAPSRRGGSPRVARDADSEDSDEGVARIARAAAARGRSGRKVGQEAMLDPTLPEKQRARRRLVGAVALVLAAVVILPMVLDAHPKPVTDDIAISIPAQDTPAARASAKRSAAADDDADAGVANPGDAAAPDAAPGTTELRGNAATNGAANTASANTADKAARSAATPVTSSRADNGARSATGADASAKGLISKSPATAKTARPTSASALTSASTPATPGSRYV
ncbi:MAG: hypothetical protein ACRYHA_06260, partial [Janthinobacterium lividum]